MRMTVSRVITVCICSCLPVGKRHQPSHVQLISVIVVARHSIVCFSSWIIRIIQDRSGISKRSNSCRSSSHGQSCPNHNTTRKVIDLDVIGGRQKVHGRDCGQNGRQRRTQCRQSNCLTKRKGCVRNDSLCALDLMLIVAPTVRAFHNF